MSARQVMKMCSLIVSMGSRANSENNKPFGRTTFFGSKQGGGFVDLISSS